MLSTSSRFTVLVLVASSLACGRPDPEAQTEAQKIDDPASLAPSETREVSSGRPSWKSSPIPMPETFAGFPRPKLEALDGIWIVDAELPHRAAVWIIEDDGSKLTVVDRHGGERILGITLSSPCALRLTDSNGRAQSRAVAQLGDQLILSSKGAVAVASPDGSLLACVGHRTYQIAADGRCRYTTEMLGVWSEPVEAKDACELEIVDKHRVLKIAGQPLHEREGLWLDEVAAAGIATPVESREAGLAVLAPKPEPVAEIATGTGETG